MLRGRWTKVVLFLVCLAPALWLGWRFYKQDLTLNPLEYIQRYTGDWTIRFICITLAVTPLRKLLRRPNLIRFRRMLGLFAFFYGCLHFGIYLYFDKLFVWADIVRDVGKRPFITMGFASLVFMLPLAITSTTGWIRRLGGKRWQLLHRLVYLAGIAAVIHYYWLVKSDVRWPLFYAGIVAVLLAYRGVAAVNSRVAPKPRKRPVPATS
jgi:methionine sulfoxide reductase heme-binding subunit